MSLVKIVFVGRDSLWNGNLIKYLQRESDFSVVGCTSSKEQGKQLLERKQFDIALLDLMMTPPSFDGLDLARDVLENKSLKIIMLAPVNESEWISSAIQAGVMNVVPKSYFGDLPTIIREAYLDHEYIHTHILEQLRNDISRLKRIEGEWALTRMEREVIQLIGKGYTRKQIVASQLIWRVENHRQWRERWKTNPPGD